MKDQQPQNGSLLGKKPRQSVLHYWVWELLSLVLSVGIIIAIIVILVKYNNQKLPEWPYSINLNTLIALLSTILRSSMVVVMAEVISQAKWSWFANHPRPLNEFQAFDDASRGVIGSLGLIGLLRFGFRGSPLAFIAAITMVLSLAVGPFSQQAIKTITCPQILQNSVASVPVANTVPGADGYYRMAAGRWDIGTGMKGAFINGLTNPSGNDSAIQATCPTGNCTFAEQDGIVHSTIGMCSKCIDTTELTHITYPPNVTNANLTLDNLWISLGINQPWFAAGATNMSFAESILTPEFKDVSEQAIINITILTASKSPCTGFNGTCPHNTTLPDSAYHGIDFVATTCSLYSCMKDVSLRVENGRLMETVVNTVPAKVNGMAFQGNGVNLYDDRLVVKSPCLIDDKIYDTGNFSLVPNVTSKRAFRDIVIDGKNVSVPTDCYYQTQGIYVMSMMQFLELEFFNGQCYWSASQSGQKSERIFLLCETAWWFQSLNADGNASFSSLEASFDNLATVATNFFRTDGWGALNTTDYRSSLTETAALAKGQIIGQVIETTVCMRLEWPWLLLPGGLCLITIFLLAAMLAINFMDRNQYVWKSSLLPLLFFGLDAQADKSTSGARGANDLGSLQKASKQITIRLDPSGYDSSQSCLIPVDAVQESGDQVILHRNSLEVTEERHQREVSENSSTEGPRGESFSVSPPAFHYQGH